MKKVKYENLNLKAIRKIMIGNSTFIHTVEEEDFSYKNLMGLLWKNNAIHDDVIAVKNNNHKVKIDLF